MRGLGAGLLLAVVAVAAAAPCRAEDQSTERVVLARSGVPRAEWKAVTVTVTWGPGGGATGWGYARVDLVNGDDSAHDVALELGDSEDFRRVTRVVRVDGNGRAKTWLPRLGGGQQRLRASVGGSDTELWASEPDTSLRVLLVTHPQRGRGLRERLEAAAVAAPPIPGRGSAACTFTETTAASLPRAWTQLSGVSLVVLHGGAPGLEDPECQGALRRYAEAGGTVFVLERDALPKGPLADALAEREEGANLGRGRIGFGRWITGAGDDLTKEAANGVVSWWLTDPVPARQPWEEAPEPEGASAVSEAFALAESIPGLGRVNVRLYFFLLLLFAVLVGPVAYLVLKRRRRLMSMLVVVPAAGLLFAGGILGYGMLSEGLGTRGVVTSVSFLDQRAHEATCVAGRTLFAGWSRAPLRLSPDTVLHAPNVPRAENRYGVRSSSPARFHLDVDAGLVDASVLPSRTVTSFASVSRARARERMRFRRRADGSYDVLTAEGFAPLPEAAMVLRDAEGSYHAGQGTGPLRPVGRLEGERLLAAFATGVAETELSDEEEDPSEHPFLRFRFTYGTPARRDRAPWVERALSTGLPPSSYVAWTTRAPALDDLGLTVDWKRARHLTVALLAPDDFDG